MDDFLWINGRKASRPHESTFEMVCFLIGNLKTQLENGESPSTANTNYTGYRVPNLREGVAMYLYCDNAAWWNGSFMVSNYYSFGYYGNQYDTENPNTYNPTYYYSWSIYSDRVTVGDKDCSRIRFVKDWNPQ